MCACVRDRERRYEERRDTGASVRERERRERVACENGSGRTTDYFSLQIDTDVK